MDARQTQATVFLDRLNEAQRLRHRQPDLAERLAARLAEARAAWPEVRHPDEAFLAHLAEVLSRPENAEESLETLLVDDLYVAAACAARDGVAVAACEARYGPGIDRALARQGLERAAADELRQKLREQLYVADASGRPYLAAYSGRGKLSGWLRVIAVRLALKSFRGQYRERPLDTDLAEKLAGTPELAVPSAERAHLKLLYQTEFKTALKAAVASLPERDRELLRRHFVGGETIDQLGELFGVHRATAARWIERARTALLRSLRRILMQQLRLDAEGYESVLKLVRSQLDLSLWILSE